MMASKARVRASDLLADLVSLRERKFELEDAANAEEEKSQVKVRENERSEAKAADLSSAQHVSKASSLLPLQSCSNMQQLDALSEDDKHLAEIIDEAIKQKDTSRICDGLRMLFEHRKRNSVLSGAGIATPDILLSVVSRSLEWAHAHMQIAELAFAWLALVIEDAPRQRREQVLATPGLVPGLCRLGENGSAQARVFAGMCLKELLKGMGKENASALISLDSFPPCINSMLCSPLEEERLSGSLVLAELIGEGGEGAVHLIFSTCAVAVASLLSGLADNIQSDCLVGLWCVGRLARTSSGIRALQEADTIEMLQRWSNAPFFVGEGKDAEYMLMVQGILLVALINAKAGKIRDGEFAMPVHTLTPLLATAVQEASRAWKHSWIRLDLWEIFYTFSILAPLESIAEEFLSSSALDFMLYALQEAVREIGIWREQQYCPSYGTNASSDLNAWQRWDLALEFLGSCLCNLIRHRACKEHMHAANLTPCLKVFAILHIEGYSKGLCRACHGWAQSIVSVLDQASQDFSQQSLSSQEKACAPLLLSEQATPTEQTKSLGGDAFEGTQRAPGKSVAAHRRMEVEIGSPHQTQNKDTSPPATKYFQIPTSLEMIWKGKENFPAQLTAGQELKRVAIEPHKKVSFVNASSDASEAPYTNCSKGHDTTQNEILEMGSYSQELADKKHSPQKSIALKPDTQRGDWMSVVAAAATRETRLMTIIERSVEHLQRIRTMSSVLRAWYRQLFQKAEHPQLPTLASVAPIIHDSPLRRNETQTTTENIRDFQSTSYDIASAHKLLQQRSEAGTVTNASVSHDAYAERFLLREAMTRTFQSNFPPVAETLSTSHTSCNRSLDMPIGLGVGGRSVLEMGVGSEEESPWSSLALEDQMKSLKNDMDQVMSRLTINNFAITSPPRSSLSAFADGSEGCDPLSYGLCTDDLPPPTADDFRMSPRMPPLPPSMPPLPPRTFCAPMHAHTKAEARSEGLASLGLSSFTSSALSSFTSAAPLLPEGDIYKNMDAKHGSFAMLARGRGPPPFAQQRQGQHTRPPLAQLAHQSNIDVAARQERALYGMYNNGGYRGNCATTNCASPQQYSAMNRNFEAAATGGGRGGRGQGGISGARREGGPPSAYSSFLESSTNTDCNRGSVCARDGGRAGAGEQLNGAYGAYASFLLDSTSHASSNNCATKLNLKAFGPSAYEDFKVYL